jgi:hypothetical protein
MAREEIPESVQRFLADNIDSVPHLEALLLLWETAPREWTCVELANRIYVSTNAAGGLLEDLSRRDMLIRVAGEPSKYRFDRTNERQHALMAVVSVTYGRHLVQIAQFIHGKASGSIRDFARAFKLKREDE